MKLLFTAGGSHSTVFSVAPLATAARNAGHEILLAADEPLMETAEAIGLPAVVTPGPAMASARLDALAELAEEWPPDLVVGGLSYLPGVLAARLKVPYVRQAWDIAAVLDVTRRAQAELEPVLTRTGLTGLPVPDLFIDVCPPSLRPSRTTGARSMRWIPRNRQRRLEPWMYTRPQGRQRVLITSGTRSLMLGTPGSIRQLVGQLTLAGAEVLIAAPPGAAEKFGTELAGTELAGTELAGTELAGTELAGTGLGDVRIGWIPLDVVAPTCDLAVHHGGAATAMTMVNAGVPQLIMPENGYAKAVAHGLSGFGAALTLLPGQELDQDPAQEIAASCQELLSSPRYAWQARVLATEIATLPTPSDIVREMETLPA